MASNDTPLLYACVAHHTTILAECTASAASQASALASLILPKIDHKTSQKLTFTHGAHYIHYISEGPDSAAAAAGHQSPSIGGLTFLVVADAALGRRVPFAFLVDVRQRFLAEYGTHDLADLPNYGCAAFNSVLKQLLAEHATATDAFADARRDIDDVRGIMGRNIESLLERGDHINLLVDQTDRLGGSAHAFRMRSRGLKRQMWWKNVKLMALLVLVVVLVIVTIVVAAKV